MKSNGKTDDEVADIPATVMPFRRPARPSQETSQDRHVAEIDEDAGLDAMDFIIAAMRDAARARR